MICRLADVGVTGGSPDRKLIWLQSVSQLCPSKHGLVLTVSFNKVFLMKGTVLYSGEYASHLTADWHLKKHCSGGLQMKASSFVTG